MAGELDSRLVGLLRASLAMVDALRDIGIEGDIPVRLDREGARRLLAVIGGRGGETFRLAGLRFEWPKDEPLQEVAGNDNERVSARGDETPALR